jgi:hypothetical protein
MPNFQKEKASYLGPAPGGKGIYQNQGVKLSDQKVGGSAWRQCFAARKGSLTFSDSFS